MAQDNQIQRSALDLVQRANNYSSGQFTPEQKAQRRAARQQALQATAPAAGSTSFAGDFGRSLGAGLLDIPSVATGLLDIPAGAMGFNRPFSRAADALGSATGFDFDTLADQVRGGYTPETQTALQRVQEAQGFGNTVTAALQNPRAIGTAIGETIPATLGGGLLGAGVKAAAGRAAANAAGSRIAAARAAGTTPTAGAGAGALRTLQKPVVAGGIGEGLVAGGFAMDNISKDVDPQKAAAAAFATAVGVGGLGMFGGALARKVGLSDPDLIFVGGRPLPKKGVKRPGIFRRVFGGAVAEGALEELPQSAYEAVVQNWAEDRPIFEGVGEQAAMGMLAGMGLGAGVNVFGGRRNMPETPAPGEQGTGEGGTPTGDDPRQAALSEKSPDDLYTLWNTLEKAAESFGDNPDMMAQLRENQNLLRREFAKRGIPLGKVNAEKQYKNYQSLRAKVDGKKNLIRDAYRQSEALGQAAERQAVASEAVLNQMEQENPVLKERYNQELEEGVLKEGIKLTKKVRDLRKRAQKDPLKKLEARQELAKAEAQLALWEQSAGTEGARQQIRDALIESEADEAQVRQDAEAAADQEVAGDTLTAEFEGTAADQLNEALDSLENIDGLPDVDEVDFNETPVVGQGVTIEGEATEVGAEEAVNRQVSGTTQPRLPALPTSDELAAVETDQGTETDQDVIYLGGPTAPGTPNVPATGQSAPTSISDTLQAQQAATEALAGIPGTPSDLVKGFLESDQEIAADARRVRNAGYVGSLNRFQAKLKTLDAAGVQKAVEIEEKALEKAEALEDSDPKKKRQVSLAKRKVKLGKYYQQQAFQKPRATGGTTTPVRATPQLPSPGATPNTPAPAVQTTAVAETGTETRTGPITDEDIAAAQAYIGQNLFTDSYPKRVTPRHARILEEYLGIVAARDPQPFKQLQLVLASKYDFGLTGQRRKMLDQSYLRDVVAGMIIKMRDAMRLVRPDLTIAEVDRYSLRASMPQGATMETLGFFDQMIDKARQAAVDAQTVEAREEALNELRLLETEKQVRIRTNQFYWLEHEVNDAAPGFADRANQLTDADRIDSAPTDIYGNPLPRDGAQKYATVNDYMDALGPQGVAGLSQNDIRTMVRVRENEAKLETQLAALNSGIALFQDMLAGRLTTQETLEQLAAHGDAETYWNLAAAGVEGAPTYEQLVQNPDGAAVWAKQISSAFARPGAFASIPDAVEPFITQLRETDTRLVSLNQELMNELGLTLKDLSDNPDGFNGKQIKELRKKRISELQARFVQRLRVGVKTAMKRMEGGLNNDEVQQRINTLRQDMQEREAQLANLVEKRDNFLALAQRNRRQKLNQFRRERAERARKLAPLPMWGGYGKVIPQDVAAELVGDIRAGQQTYRELLAEQEQRPAPVFDNKVQRDVYRMRTGTLSKGTWVKHSDRTTETTVGLSGVMYTIQRNPENPKQYQLYIVRNSEDGQITDIDSLWAETGPESGIKTKAQLKEYAKTLETTLNAEVVDPEAKYEAQEKAREARKVAAVNAFADARAARADRVGETALLTEEEAQALKGAINQEPMPGVKVKRRKPKIDTELRRPRRKTLVHSANSMMFNESSTGHPAARQVIGDARVPGNTPEMVEMTSSMEPVERGGYGLRLTAVRVAVDDFIAFMGAYAPRAAAKYASLNPATLTYQVRMLQDTPLLAGPVINMQAGTVQNFAQFMALQERGATHVWVSMLARPQQTISLRASLKKQKGTRWAPGATEAKVKQLEYAKQFAKEQAARDYARERAKLWLSYQHKRVTNPSSVQSVRDELRAFLPNGAQNLTVVQSLYDLMGLMESNGIKVSPSAGGFVYQGRAYLIADNIQQGNAPGVLLHEVGVHNGMSQEMVNSLAAGISDLVVSGDPIAQAALLRVQAMTQYAAGNGAIIDEADFNQELVAYFTEEAVNNYGIMPSDLGKMPAPVRNLMRRVMNFIRAVLGKFGLRLGRLEARNIVDLAYGMANNPMRRPVSSDEVRESLAAQTDGMARFEAGWRELGDSGKQSLESWSQIAKRYRDRVMFTYDYAKKVAQDFPMVNRFLSIMQRKQTERSAVDEALQKLATPFERMPTARRTAINEFLLETQFANAWAFDPAEAGIRNPVQAFNVSEELASKLAKFSASEQAFIKSVFVKASELQDKLHDAQTREIEHRYMTLIESAEFGSEDLLKLQQDMLTDLATHDSTRTQRIPGWLPLRRHGKYATIFVSEELRATRRDAEAMSDPASARVLHERVRELKADPRHYSVEFSESSKFAIQRRDEINNEVGKGERAPGQATDILREQMDYNGDLVPSYMYNALLQNVRAQKVTEGGDTRNVTAKALERVLTKAYLLNLNQTSYRKSELNRLNVSGADRNMMRGFLEYGQSIGSAISALETTEEIAGVMDEMRGIVRDSPADMRRRRSEIFAEIQYRYINQIDIDPNPMVDKIMGYTSLGMLLTSPAYYLQNSTQPWLMTLPILSGQFGFVRSARALGSKYGIVSKAWGAAHKGVLREMAAGNISGWGGELADIDSIREQIGEPAANMLQYLKDQGVFDVGIAADFGSLFGDAQGGVQEKVSAIHKKLVHAVRSVEVFNRGATALAAFELAQGNPSVLPKITVEENGRAVTRQMTPDEYAMDVVMGTQGDYSGTNAPSLIRRMGPIGKVITQFRKFQLIQVTMLMNLMSNVYDGQGPVTRAVAARQLGFLMGTNFAVGGLLAMPAINIAGLVFNSFKGDEPDDIEQQIRQWAGDPDLADLILKGFPTVIDQDWSGKLGWGTTFSIMPFTDFEVSREGLTKTFATLVGGPTLALGGNMAEGVNQMMQGNVATGSVELLPRGLRDMGRAYNLAAKGLQDKSPMQRQLIEAEEITGYQVLSQAIGLPTADLNRVRSVNRGRLNAKRFYDDRLTSLKADWYAAFQSNDAAAKARIRQDFLKLQGSRVSNGFTRQDISVLTSSIQQVRAAQQNVRGGVATTRENRRYVEDRL